MIDRMLLDPVAPVHDIQEIARPDGTSWTAPLLYHLAMHIPAGDFVETGLYDGYTSIWLALAAERLSRRYYGIEVKKERADRVARKLQALGLDRRSRVIHGSSLAPESWDPVGSVGLAFLDGDHRKEAVEKEWAILLPKLLPGAIVALHDTQTRPGPRWLATELLREGWRGLDLGVRPGLVLVQKP